MIPPRRESKSHKRHPAAGHQGVWWATGGGWVFVTFSSPATPRRAGTPGRWHRGSAAPHPLSAPWPRWWCPPPPTPERASAALHGCRWFQPGHCIRPADGMRIAQRIEEVLLGPGQAGWRLSSASGQSSVAFLCFLFLALLGVEGFSQLCSEASSSDRAGATVY